MTKLAPSYHPHYAATVWPSGDFSLSSLYRREQGNTERGKPLTNAAQCARDMYWVEHFSESDPAKEDCKGVVEAAERINEIAATDIIAYKTACAVRDHRLHPDRLGLSVVINSRKNARSRARRGLTGITVFGRRMVRSCVKLMSDRHHRLTLCFGTATVPPLSDDGRRTLAKNWSILCKRFMEWLKYQSERVGLEADVVIISEIQEKRLEKFGEAYPHLHWLAVGKHHPFEKKWAVSPERIDKYWSKLIARYSGEKPGCEYSCKLEVPRRDPKAELGKYMSKGGKLIQKAAELGQAEFLPSCWWQAPLALRREVKSKIWKLPNTIAYALRASLDKLEHLGIAKGRVIVGTQQTEKGDREIEFGAVGFFVNDEAFNTFMGMWQDLGKIEIFTPKFVNAEQNASA